MQLLGVLYDKLSNLWCYKCELECFGLNFVLNLVFSLTEVYVGCWNYLSVCTALLKDQKF